MTNLVTIFGFQSCLRLILDIPVLATSVEDFFLSFFLDAFLLSLEELILGTYSHFRFIEGCQADGLA